MANSSHLILYRASAGSGKTYTLAKEYLKIVIRNPYDYNKILAVTFTRKATEEMKTRIIEYLSRLEKKDPKMDSMRKAIISEVMDSGVDLSEKFDEHVSKALQLILHDYSNFNISTIDSFFQGIIRSFAKELDLPVGMEVELDTDSVIQQGVQDMLKEYKTDKDAFSKWIEEYLVDLIDEDKGWKIDRHISKLARQILGEEYQLLAMQHQQQFDIETYRGVLKELKQLVFDYRKHLTQLTQDVIKKIANENLDLSLYYYGTKSVQSFINKVKEFNPEANSYVQKMLGGGDLYSKSKLKDKIEIDRLESAWNSYLIHYIQDTLSHRERYHKKYIAADVVLKNIYSLALLEFINARIRQYKADENLILISDTNQIISLIAQHEEVPFIFEKSANFLKYILIDEFQDTSSLQWKGLLPLLLEILQNVSGLVLIVGDPKQSIYRWRGGKMELIIDGIKPDLLYHWDERKEISLEHNYRSAKEIVEFNNAFFHAIREHLPLQHPLFKNVLSDVVQEIDKIGEKGFVQIKWLEKNKKDEEESEDVQLEETLRIVREVHETRGYSDIAVLTRNNFHGSEVANYLQENGIPVVSAESLLLRHHLPVRIMMAAFEYIQHPLEEFYRVKLNYLYAKFLKKENPESYLEKKENYFFEEQMPQLSRKKVFSLASLPMNELLFLLLRETKLDVQMDNYLLRFQDIVLQNSQKYSNSIAGFLEFWEDQQNKLSILPPEGMDAVKIYTIHKSKGLQFPVVIVPYANWRLKPKPDATIWVKSEEKPFDQLHAFPVEMTKKIEDSLFADDYNREAEWTYMDNINLLYVAFTRAENQLYVLSTQEKENKDELPGSVGKLLTTILPKMGLEGDEIPNEYSYGVRETQKQNENVLVGIKNILPVALKNFKEKIKLVTREEYNEAQVKGNLLHSVLSKVYEAQHIYKAVHSTIPDSGQLDIYREITDKIISEFSKQGWLDAKWQQINERTILYKGEELRPDKVLLSETECIIVDYKSGAKKAEHEKQMKKYMEAYQSFYTQQISGFLIYIEEMKIAEVK